MKIMSHLKNQKRKRRQINSILHFDLILFLLKFFVVDLITIKNRRYLDNYDSEIHLVVKGSGYINILNNNFTPLPYEVIVNGKKDNSCMQKCYLNNNNEENKIILKFNETIDSCESMFEGSTTIISVDLSKFDASKVTSMFGMFYQCSSLKEINFGNIDTSSLNNMRSLFNGCSSLTTVDLSKFDTSKVTTMARLFNFCSHLEKINFGDIRTPSLEDMEALFNRCSSLTTVDLSKFDTSKVTTMAKMFYDCKNLKFLDLSNFNISKVTEMEYMFYYCESLIYLNLKNFQIMNHVEKYEITYSINRKVKYCIKDLDTKNYLIPNEQSNCSDDCFRENIKIDIKNDKCIDTCLNHKYEGYLYDDFEYYGDIYYKYEYNNICYSKCPKDTYALFCDINECDGDIKKCFDETPEGYYLDTKNETYKKCFKNCKFCHGEGNETINNCQECKSNFTFLNEIKFKTNCYENCEHYYYFDDSNNYNCTEDFQCPVEYNKLITEKNKCINECKIDDTFKYEYNNQCFKYCPNDTYGLEDNKYLCYNTSLDGYYLDRENEIYKKCFETCYKCDKGGNQINHNCIKCKFNYTFYNNSKNISNCYPICDYYYYFDESNNFHCNKTCPEKYKLIINKSKCIDDCKKDETNKYEYNNTCYDECPKDSYLLEDIFIR